MVTLKCKGVGLLSGVELWDAIWKKHEVLFSENDPIFSAVERTVTKMDGCQSIIELGCGSGFRTLLLAKKYGLSATLVDFSINALTLAKRIATKLKLYSKIRFIWQDVFDERLIEDFRERFDIVWSGGLNEHFTGLKRQKIFDIMVSICKPDGFWRKILERLIFVNCVCFGYGKA